MGERETIYFSFTICITVNSRSSKLTSLWLGMYKSYIELRMKRWKWTWSSQLEQPKRSKKNLKQYRLDRESNPDLCLELLRSVDAKVRFLFPVKPVYFRFFSTAYVARHIHLHLISDFTGPHDLINIDTYRDNLMGKKNLQRKKSRPFNLISISVFSFRGMRVIVEGRLFL